MIFVTVGSQTPFDRLVSAADEWAKSRSYPDIFAQLAGGRYRPQHMRFADFMTPTEFSRAVREANVIVAHAGMGTIITALELGKPIVVMPRLAKLQETRNDHQVATAERFAAQGQVLVASDETRLSAALDRAMAQQTMTGISSHASPRLIAAVRDFLNSDSSQLHTDHF